MTPLSPAQRLKQFPLSRELLTIGEMRASGLSDSAVSRLTRAGVLERAGRGLYRRAEAKVTEHHDLQMVMAKAGRAVVVLISALRFHGMGTQVPREVWIQISASGRPPAIAWPPVRVVRTRLAAAFTEGVKVHDLGGIRVPVTTPARTVADCFKHRRHIGMEACLEALRELLAGDRNIMPELTKYARMNQVLRVMQPYLEAMS